MRSVLECYRPLRIIEHTIVSLSYPTELRGTYYINRTRYARLFMIGFHECETRIYKR